MSSWFLELSSSSETMSVREFLLSGAMLPGAEGTEDWRSRRSTDMIRVIW